METKPETASQKRAHIYEIDLIRAITVFSVVAIHALSYTNFLVTNPFAFKILTLFGHTLHYNREMFVFVTGLVLTYVYFNKPFSIKKFWLKRFSLVLIPYILWSILYVFINNHNLTFFQYLQTSVWDIITGEASFQLYYILLALQFYAIFPFFLWLLRKVARYPWRTLLVSFIVQLVFIYLDYHYLQPLDAHSPELQQKFVHFQDRIFFLYQFFFFLGGFTAVYMDASKKFLVKFGKYIPLVLLVALVVYEYFSFQQINAPHVSLSYATSVLQPSVVVYSTVVILFFAYLATLWVTRRLAYNLVKIISDTSFGIYFVHVLVLTYIAEVLPLVPESIPVLIKIISVIFLAFFISVVICLVILKISWLSWTIGKGQSLGKSIPSLYVFKALQKKLRLAKRNLFLLFVLLILLLGLGVVAENISQLHSHQKNLVYTSKHKEASLSTHAFSFQNTVTTTTSSITYTPIPSSGCSKQLAFKPGTSTTIGIISDHVHRLYRLYIPTNYSNWVQHPLVLGFHGYGSNAIKQEQLTKFDPLANQYSFIVVYPQGTPDRDGLLGWNTGLYPDIKTNDVLFVSNILNQVQSNLCVNPSQIYATGFSNGGGFVNKLALTLPNRIAAFAPVSGSYVSPFIKRLSRAVPIIEFHGTADRTVPYNGDPEKNEFSVTAWINNWIAQDGCHPKPQTIYHASKVIGYSWTGCENNASIVEYRLIGEHHIWPISLFKQTVDKKTESVTASALIWQFFMQHPLNRQSPTAAL